MEYLTTWWNSLTTDKNFQIFSAITAIVVVLLVIVFKIRLWKPKRVKTRVRRIYMRSRRR